MVFDLYALVSNILRACSIHPQNTRANRIDYIENDLYWSSSSTLFICYTYTVVYTVQDVLLRQDQIKIMDSPKIKENLFQR